MLNQMVLLLYCQALRVPDNVLIQGVNKEVSIPTVHVYQITTNLININLFGHVADLVGFLT